MHLIPIEKKHQINTHLCQVSYVKERVIIRKDLETKWNAKWNFWIDTHKFDNVESPNISETLLRVASSCYSQLKYLKEPFFSGTKSLKDTMWVIVSQRMLIVLGIIHHLSLPPDSQGELNLCVLLCKSLSGNRICRICQILVAGIWIESRVKGKDAC